MFPREISLMTMMSHRSTQNWTTMNILEMDERGALRDPLPLRIRPRMIWLQRLRKLTSCMLTRSKQTDFFPCATQPADLWLQARLTLTLKSFYDKWTRLLVLAAMATWLQGDPQAISPAVHEVARVLTLRLAAHLAKYVSRLMRHASDLTDPHTECLMYTTYWVRPILHELLSTTAEGDEANKQRAPSGPVIIGLRQDSILVLLKNGRKLAALQLATIIAGFNESLINHVLL